MFIILYYSSLFAQAKTPSITADKTAIETTSFIADSTSIDSIKKKNERIPEPIYYQSLDSITLKADSKMIRMYNKGKVKSGKEELEANYIEADMPKNLLHASFSLDSTKKEIGYPVFKDGNTEYTTRGMSYNTKSRKGLVTDILTQEGEGYIQGEVAKQISPKAYCLKNGRYTTCDNHDHPHYYIGMKKLKMIKDDKVVSGLTYLVIEDVVIPIGLPFALFPLKDKYSSGIIIPSFGEERNRGFFLRNFGYYWAASKYFDLRFDGSAFTNGSWEASLHSSYKKRYKFNGNISLSYSINKLGDKGLDDYSEQKDFSFRWTHAQDSKAHPYRNISASVNISSSQNDYNNAYSLEKIVNSTKQSSISYTRRWPDSPFNLSIALQHSQNKRDTTISLTLPNVNFSMQTQYPLRRKNTKGQTKWYEKISVGYRASLVNKISIHEDKLLKSKLNRDWRNGFEHNIPVGASYKIARDLTFSASLNYKGVAYANSIRKSYDPIKDKVVTDTLDGFNYAHNITSSTSIAFTPKIFGIYSFGKNSRVSAIRHVMSPSISVGYTPDFGLKQDKYFRTYSVLQRNEDIRYNILENGTMGFPRDNSKSGNINFSLDNNIEMKIKDTDNTSEEDKTTKIKLLESFRLSTSYNIFADSMKFSNINLSARTSLFKRKVSLQMSGTVDPYKLTPSGRRINKYNGGLGRLTATTLSIGTSFKGGNGNKDEGKSDNNNEPGKGIPNMGNTDIESFNDASEYVDFKVPWSIRVDYNFRYTKPLYESTISQNLRVSGDINLTKKWKVSFSTGYDFSQKEVTTSSFSIFRDLHCWEMNFTAIPFGNHQSYSFRIAVKSSLLKDLKLQKRDSWYDNF